MKEFNSIIRNQSILNKLFWVWIVIIYILAIIPNVNPPKIEIGQKFEIRFDYIVHSILYFLLTFFYFLWKRDKFNLNFFKSHLLYLLLIILIAISTEFIQKYLPKRGFNYIDIFYNFIGIVMAAVFIFYLLKTGRKNTA